MGVAMYALNFLALLFVGMIGFAALAVMVLLWLPPVVQELFALIDA